MVLLRSVTTFFIQLPLSVALLLSGLIALISLEHIQPFDFFQVNAVLSAYVVLLLLRLLTAPIDQILLFRNLLAQNPVVFGFQSNTVSVLDELRRISAVAFRVIVLVGLLLVIVIEF